MLPKTSAYVQSYDGQTKRMYFLMTDDDLLQKYNTIWDKVSANIKKKIGKNENFLINLIVLKLQTLTIKKFLKWILIILFSSN